MEWECACKFCLKYKYSGPSDEDPLTFEIEPDCTCEACMQIHYSTVRKHGWNLHSIAHAPPVGLEGKWEDCLLTFHLRLVVYVKHVGRLELNIKLLFKYCIVLF